MTKNHVLTNRQIARAALVVLIGFFASGVFGLLRNIVFNAMFGASAELEAFYAAQRIPELLFTLVAGGALGSSFIPIFSKYLANEDSTSAWQLASATMSLSALAAGALGLILVLLAPFYMQVLYRREIYQPLAVHLTQIMMVTTVIFSISGLLMGILNIHRNFLLPSLALSMNNIGLIVGAIVIAPLLRTDHGLFAYPAIRPLAAVQMLPDATAVAAYLAPRHLNVYGLAIGAVLGAALHLLVQVGGLGRIGAQLRFLPNPRISGVTNILGLMLPRMLGLGITQINFLVNTTFTTSMVIGSLIALTNAWFLMFFALGMIAQSIGTAIFPSLSALAAANDFTGYRERLSNAMRSVLFLAFPATIGFMVLGNPVITVLYQRGAFTAEATAATAWALLFFAVGIPGHALLEVLSRAFYALSDTRTPVLIGIAAMLANIILSFAFIQFIGTPTSLANGAFAGLALSNSLTTLVESGVLWFILRRRIGGIHDSYIIDGAARALFAASLMGAAVWLIVRSMAEASPLFTALIGGSVGVIIFFALTLLLGMNEARTIPNLILQRLRR